MIDKIFTIYDLLAERYKKEPANPVNLVNPIKKKKTTSSQQPF